MAKARKGSGIRQDQMADRLTQALGRNVSKASVATWETGRHRPGNDTGEFLAIMRAWAGITDVPVEWIIGLDEQLLVAAAAVDQQLRESPCLDSTAAYGRRTTDYAPPIDDRKIA